jgi:membrane-associated HD superfamily phosphohydrolase
MSTKPAANSNSGRFARLAGAVKKFSSTLSDKAVVDGGVGLFIVIALSLMLLRNYQRPQIDALPVGAIAPADIVAPDDIKPIEDTEETERARNQATASVLPVFDFNPKATRDVRNSIETMFATGREGFRETSPDQLRQNIKDASGIILDLDQVGILIKHRFDNELERLMIDHIELVMMTGVIDRRTLLVKLGATGIARRDVKTG